MAEHLSFDTGKMQALCHSLQRLEIEQFSYEEKLMALLTPLIEADPARLDWLESQPLAHRGCGVIPTRILLRLRDQAQSHSRPTVPQS